MLQLEMHSEYVNYIAKVSCSPVLINNILPCIDTLFFSMQVKVTLLDVFNGCSVREKAKNSLLKCYPEARLAYFKEQSTVPYLSDPDTFNMYVMVSECVQHVCDGE